MRDSVRSVGFGSLVTGSGWLSLIIRDGDMQLTYKARMKSDDYFQTLAVEFENLTVDTNDELVQTKLSELIKEFEYLQQHYQLVPKQYDKPATSVIN